MDTTRGDEVSRNPAPDGAAWWRQWPFNAWPGLAPQQLSQAINPGWTFGNVSVTSVNSSAPDIERDVVSAHSYGRQIGKLMDAVASLAERLPAAADDPRMRAFAALAADVDRIKRRAGLSRVERLRDDLAALKADDPAAFAELRDLLTR